jgi:hypothetical protein
MSVLNRVVAATFWLLLLVCTAVFAVAPFQTLAALQRQLTEVETQLVQLQAGNATNFIIGQATTGIVAVVVFGLLFWLTAIWGYRRGVRIRTVEGGSAELDTDSIGRRLEWELEQVAEVSNVVPIVKARGDAVDIRLELEVAPEVDIPMKTNEVLIITRNVIEEDIGLHLGKLDVHLRCAPPEPEFA